MNAFLEFLKWLIKISLLLGAAIVAAVMIFFAGRRSATRAAERGDKR